MGMIRRHQLHGPMAPVGALELQNMHLCVQAFCARHGWRQAVVVRSQRRDGGQRQQRLQRAGAGRHAEHQRRWHPAVHLQRDTHFEHRVQSIVLPQRTVDTWLNL